MDKRLNPLISIIVPVFNSEQYVQQCLDSLVNQTYKNIEVICIDDGSEDKSADIIIEYVHKDKRIKYERINNSGVSIARNKGISLANGDYIMFVDADDWIDNETCESALIIAMQNDTDVVMWDYIREYSNKSLPKNIFYNNMFFDKNEIKEKLHRRMVGIVGVELNQLENADALCTVWGKLYKKKCILDNGINFYDINEIGTYEDGLFNLNVFAHVNNVCYVHKYFYHYRKVSNSITNCYNPHLQYQHERIHKYLKMYIENNKLDNQYLEALNNRISLELITYGLNIISNKEINNIEKIKEIKEILQDDHYSEALRALDLRYMKIHWKIFYKCAKSHYVLIIYILLLCIKSILNRFM